MTEERSLYKTSFDNMTTAQQRQLRLTDAEMRLVLRLRQAAGQGRLLVVDADAMTWYLCGPPEHGR
jgi:hypothetical protein